MSRHYPAFTITAAWAAVKRYSGFTINRLILLCYPSGQQSVLAAVSVMRGPARFALWGNLFHTFYAPENRMN
jgi:hypothetical protein